jgi:hypothetical protein
MNKTYLRLIPLVFFVLVFASCSRISYGIRTVPNTETDVFRYTVEISNDIEQIQPLVFLGSSYEPVSEQDDVPSSKFTDYIGMYGYDMVMNRDLIPSIVETDQLALILSDTTQCMGVEVYDSDGISIDSWSSWEENSPLETGQYFLILSIHNETNGYYVNAQYLFVLTVE